MVVTPYLSDNNTILIGSGIIVELVFIVIDSISYIIFRKCHEYSPLKLLISLVIRS